MSFYVLLCCCLWFFMLWKAEFQLVTDIKSFVPCYRCGWMRGDPPLPPIKTSLSMLMESTPLTNCFISPCHQAVKGSFLYGCENTISGYMTVLAGKIFSSCRLRFPCLSKQSEMRCIHHACSLLDHQDCESVLTLEEV